MVLAVKPQSMRQVLAQLRPVVTAEHLIVSIAAGITIASIVQGLGRHGRVVRVMPNTPALVGEGASAYALGRGRSRRGRGDRRRAVSTRSGRRSASPSRCSTP